MSKSKRRKIMFCFHKWKIKEVVYHPSNVKSFNNASYRMAKIMMYGYSNIHLQCEKCGDIKTQEECGDARSLMEKTK
jgi:hypothetical protein